MGYFYYQRIIIIPGNVIIHLLSYICDHISNIVDVLLIFHLPG